MVKKEKETKEKDLKKKDTKKVSRKDTKKKEVKKDVTPHGFKAFRMEAKKVKWPTRKEMVKYTIATLVFILFFATLFLGIQALMSLIKTLIKQ